MEEFGLENPQSECMIDLPPLLHQVLDNQPELSSITEEPFESNELKVSIPKTTAVALTKYFITISHSELANVEVCPKECFISKGDYIISRKGVGSRNVRSNVSATLGIFVKENPQNLPCSRYQTDQGCLNGKKSLEDHFVTIPQVKGKLSFDDKGDLPIPMVFTCKPSCWDKKDLFMQISLEIVEIENSKRTFQSNFIRLPFGTEHKRKLSDVKPDLPLDFSMNQMPVGTHVNSEINQYQQLRNDFQCLLEVVHNLPIQLYLMFETSKKYQSNCEDNGDNFKDLEFQSPLNISNNQVISEILCFLDELLDEEKITKENEQVLRKKAKRGDVDLLFTYDLVSHLEEKEKMKRIFLRDILEN